MLFEGDQRRVALEQKLERLNIRLEDASDDEDDVLICIGETLAERETGRTLAVLESQLKGSVPAGSAAAKRRSTSAFAFVRASSPSAM